MKDLLLGIDLGTGGCKTTIIDSDGAFVADGYTEYVTYHPFSGWSEQKAADWFPAFLNSLHIALEKSGVSAGQIVALSLDASAHNAVLLDRNDHVLLNTIMWTDQRSTQEVAFLLENYREEIFRRTFHKPSPTWTLPQLMWLKRNHPTEFAKTDRLMFIKDYIRYLLTGEWKTDHIEAQGSLLFDNLSWEWSSEICAMGGIPLTILPPLVKPTDIAGHITEQASKLTGIKVGTPVINGASDTALENYCVGAIQPGYCVVKMATAGNVCMFYNEPHPNPNGFTYSHVVDGLWYSTFGTNSAAQSLRWYRDVFCQSEINAGKNVYQLLDEEAEAVPPGSDGVMFHPYLMGERSPYWDPKLRASFVGVTAAHSRGHFNRAILEGVAYSIKDNFTRMEGTKDVKEIRFLGGGAKSALWRSILANVLNKPVLKFAKDDSSLGSALLAGVSVGIFANHEEAIQKSVRLSSQVSPVPEIAEAYEKHFANYRKVHDVLAEIYHTY